MLSNATLPRQAGTRASLLATIARLIESARDRWARPGPDEQSLFLSQSIDAAELKNRMQRWADAERRDLRPLV